MCVCVCVRIDKSRAGTSRSRKFPRTKILIGGCRRSFVKTKELRGIDDDTRKNNTRHFGANTQVLENILKHLIWMCNLDRWTSPCIQDFCLRMFDISFSTSLAPSNVLRLLWSSLFRYICIKYIRIKCSSEMSLNSYESFWRCTIEAANYENEANL